MVRLLVNCQEYHRFTMLLLVEQNAPICQIHTIGALGKRVMIVPPCMHLVCTDCCLSLMLGAPDANPYSCTLYRRDLQMKKSLDVYVVGDNHRNNLYEVLHK